MTSTGYTVTPDMQARQATIHQRGADGTIGLLDPQPAINTGREYGGGGLNGTAPDYQRFIRMILNGGSGNGNQLLKPETVAEMSKNQMGDVRVKMLPTTNPARSLDAEFFPGVPKSWGLTFMINDEQAPTGRPAGSLAWAGLYNTFFWIDPVNKVGGVFMSQLLPFVDTKTLQAFYGLRIGLLSRRFGLTRARRPGWRPAGSAATAPAGPPSLKPEAPSKRLSVASGNRALTLTAAWAQRLRRAAAGHGARPARCTEGEGHGQGPEAQQQGNQEAQAGKAQGRACADFRRKARRGAGPRQGIEEVGAACGRLADRRAGREGRRLAGDGG